MQRVLEPEVMDTIEDAVGYDAMDHSEPNAAFVARLTELRAHGRMLDIGTGPGHIPLLLCEKCADATVLGIDLSRNMLAIAGQHRAASAFADRVRYCLADAKCLPFPDAHFDAVFSNTLLHHLPNPRPLLVEAWRVLRPGGALLIRDLLRPATQQQLDALVATHTGDATPHQQHLFRASLLAALTPAELWSMVNALNLTGVSLVVDTDHHMSLQQPATLG